MYCLYHWPGPEQKLPEHWDADHVPGLGRLWCCDSLTLKWTLKGGLCKTIEQVCIVCIIGQAQSKSCQSVGMLTHVPGLRRLWCCDSLTLKWTLKGGLCKAIEQVCIVCIIGQAQSKSCQSVGMLTHVPGLRRLWCCDSLTLKWTLKGGLCKAIEQVRIVCIIGQAQSKSCQSIGMLTMFQG